MSQGFYWWQIDIAGYVVRAMSWVGLVWDVRSAPERVLALGRTGLKGKAAAEQLAEVVMGRLQQPTA
jgi:stearoyl-CoA desaturase (delta-9 desaturase)